MRYSQQRRGWWREVAFPCAVAVVVFVTARVWTDGGLEWVLPAWVGFAVASADWEGAWRRARRRRGRIKGGDGARS